MKRYINVAFVYIGNVRRSNELGLSDSLCSIRMLIIASVKYQGRLFNVCLLLELLLSDQIDHVRGSARMAG